VRRIAQFLPRIVASPFDKVQLSSEQLHAPAERPERDAILAQLKSAFGPERAKAFANEARQLHADIGRLDDTALQHIVDRVRGALDQLDVARRVRGNERSQERISARIDDSLRQAGTFETDAAKRGQRREREQLRQAGATHRESVALRRAELAELVYERKQLDKDPNRPDAWLARYGDDVRLAIAAQAEQRARLDQQRDAVRRGPSEQVAGRPTLDAPEAAVSV
jgi:hypothetical protein